MNTKLSKTTRVLAKKTSLIIFFTIFITSSTHFPNGNSYEDFFDHYPNLEKGLDIITREENRYSAKPQFTQNTTIEFQDSKTLQSHLKSNTEILEKARTQYTCNHWDEVIKDATQQKTKQEKLKFLIACESGCNDKANNSGTYLGLLQFHKNTFHLYGSGNIWDGKNQIQAALNILNNGGFEHHWPACSTKYYNKN